MEGKLNTDGKTLWINTEEGCICRIKCDDVFIPNTGDHRVEVLMDVVSETPMLEATAVISERKYEFSMDEVGETIISPKSFEVSK